MKIIILFFLLLFCSSFNDERQINYQGLYNEILEQGLEFPDIVFAQAILESGHFKSKIFKKNKNLFGMKYPSKRKTVSLGKRYGYSFYEFWEESVEDYYLYQEYLLKKKKISRSQYFLYLDRNYASNKGYSKKLQVIILLFKRILYTPPKDRNDGSLNNTFVIP
jgi:flagellum-specific peptidoglycan hydrolase FlgJ